MKLRLAVVTLVALCLALSAPAFAQEIFDDGPIDGYTNALFIDGPNPGPFSQNISDGFVAAASGVPSVLDFGMWVPTGLTPTTVTWWLGTSAFGSDIGSGISNDLQITFHNHNDFGYDVYNVQIDGLDGFLTFGNTYWLSLGNANDSGGTQFDAWDVNNGPATCNFGVGGQNFGDCGTGGESFIFPIIPEPGTMILLSGGVLAAVGALRRELGF